MGLKVLSLFDGIATGRYCLEQIGINVDTYYASEIDEQAISIARYNYPDIIQLGNVTNWRNWNIDWKSIDLLMGGSPCTNLLLKNQKIDEQLKLFYEFNNILNILKVFNPKIKFLFETVAPMSSENKNIITTMIGCEPLFLDSALVSAQKRKRFYWTNIPVNLLSLIDKKIFISNILQDIQDIEPKMYMSEKMITTFKKPSGKKGIFVFKPMKKEDQVKSKTLTSRYWKMGRTDPYIEDENGIRKLTPIECERLQTLPDNYTKYGLDILQRTNIMSNTARYKVLGNGWTSEIITFILQGLKNNQ